MVTIFKSRNTLLMKFDKFQGQSFYVIFHLHYFSSCVLVLGKTEFNPRI